MQRSSLYHLIMGLAVSAMLVHPVMALAGPFDGWYDEDTSFNAKPDGSVFHQTLFSEYQKLSKDRNRAFGDSFDAELFNHKALLASTRTAVQQDAVSDRALPADQQKIFRDANNRLNSVFEKGGREMAPVETAVAQVSYDCWIEAAERKSNKDAQSCMEKFVQSISAAEAKSPYGLGQVRIAAAEPAPAPLSTPFKDYYTVPFVFDQTSMTGEGESVLAEAIKDATAHPDLKIALRAHADRSGANDYNLKLSKRRAEAVLNRMSSAGIDGSRLRIVEAVGESKPLVPTADGVKEERNRVVEIDLRQ